MRPAHLSSTALIGLLLSVALACDASKPEFADGDTVIIASTLAAETVTNRHEFAVTKSGTVEARLTVLTVSDPGTGEFPETPFLALQLGRPAEETCSTTRTEFLEQGQSFTVFLESRVYCLQVSRSAALPADSMIDYTIRIASHF